MSALASTLLTLLARALAAGLAAAGWRAAQGFGGVLGRLYWGIIPRDRRRALAHLALAFPALSAAERRRLARAAFRHQAMSLCELLHLASQDCAAVASHVSVEGWGEIEAARRAGRSILILSGHLGNWELIAAALNCRGLGMAVVVRQIEERGLDELLAAIRRHFGSEPIARGTPGAARRLLTALRPGHALGMLIDQDTRVDGVWVPFFGEPAYTPTGAAEIALRRHAAVLPTFIERLPGGSHRLQIHPPLALPGDVTAATALMTRTIEEAIRRAPEQWVWMHRRWKRRPGWRRPDARLAAGP